MKQPTLGPGTGETNNLFVYGTLMQGNRNHWRLRGGKFLGKGTTLGLYSLIDRGQYPVMTYPHCVPKPTSPFSTQIMGEVYTVGRKVIAMNDSFEGHPFFYKRMLIPVMVGRAQVFCFAYVGTPEIFSIHKHLPIIPIVGKWYEKHKQPCQNKNTSSSSMERSRKDSEITGSFPRLNSSLKPLRLTPLS